MNGGYVTDHDGNAWLAADADSHESPDVDEPSRHSTTPSSATVGAAPDEKLLQDCIARIVDRDQEALAALYAAVVGRVYGMALRMTRQAALAEEVTQDTFWQIWRQAPRFAPERGSTLAWIMTMARSRALDALRRIEPGQCELEAEVLERAESPEKEAPPDLLNAMQEGHYLYATLASLDPLPRQLLSLAFFRGLSHEEIAGHTGMPLGTVKSHIRRALATLRQLLVPHIDSRH
jgi:RNA polymerase sigma-70 factor (ECF subfamily)